MTPSSFSLSGLSGLFHFLQEDSLLLDIFSYLDKIQECLDLASVSPSSCLDGIAKADEALRQSQGDSGIQCTILMKRAQLLFIAVCAFLCV